MAESGKFSGSANQSLTRTCTTRSPPVDGHHTLMLPRCSVQRSRPSDFAPVLHAPGVSRTAPSCALFGPGVAKMASRKASTLFLFRDSSGIEPRADAYQKQNSEDLDTNIYEQVAKPTFIACPEDIWAPRIEDDNGNAVEEMHVKTQFELYVEGFKRSTVNILDHGVILCVVCVGTFWALFAEDVAHGWPLAKTVDTQIAIVNFCFLIFFVAEQFARSIVQRKDYLFNFFWWMELVSVRCSNARPGSAHRSSLRQSNANPQHPGVTTSLLAHTYVACMSRPQTPQ